MSVLAGMGVKRFRTLAEIIREDGNLLAVCRFCPRRAVLPATELYRYFACRNWPSALEVLPHRLRCSRCGRRDPYIEPTGERPNAAWQPPRGEDEWKRLVRGLRG